MNVLLNEELLLFFHFPAELNTSFKDFRLTMLSYQAIFFYLFILLLRSTLDTFFNAVIFFFLRTTLSDISCST